MRKIIINKCFGGYSWSNKALLDYLNRKDIKDYRLVRFCYSPEKYEDIPQYKFFDDNFKPFGKAILVKGKYLNDTLYNEDEWYSFYGGMINREDPVAIQLLEEKGSKYCSGIHSELKIEEYDEEDWIPSIDEYDGMECLELIAKLSEKRIRDCNSIDEVVKLLERLKLFKE